MRKQAGKFGDKLKLLDNSQVLEILGEDKVAGVKMKHRGSGEEAVIEAEGVFVEIGLIPNSELIGDGLVNKTRLGEIMVDCGCRTSLELFYGAGDVTTVPYKQIVISAGEGAKAALSAYDDLTQKGLL